MGRGYLGRISLLILVFSGFILLCCRRVWKEKCIKKKQQQSEIENRVTVMISTSLLQGRRLYQLGLWLLITDLENLTPTVSCFFRDLLCQFLIPGS